MLMIDYSKAFDQLPHETIIRALVSLNAPRELITWISSYLSLRKQAVKVNGKISEWSLVPSGVPQGGILSPILFAISTNSLSPICENSSLIKFADDMFLLHFVRNANSDNLSEELAHILSWSAKQGLQFNSDKTKVIDFQTTKSFTLSPLVTPDSNIIIKNVSSAKVLGLHFDSDLSWEVHVKTTLCKARKRIYMLYCLRQAGASTETLWMIYCSMIRSICSYSYPAWCNVSNSRFEQFVKFERRICRLFDLNPHTASPTIQTHCESLAHKLAVKALEPYHPLNLIYDSCVEAFHANWKSPPLNLD